MPTVGHTIARLAEEIRTSVDDDLQRVVPADMQPVVLAEAMRHGLLAPAKRIRSILLVLSADLFECPRAASIRAACAIELVHAASLVLDDLPAMDDAALRRGIATTHRAYGDATAILAAIALLNAGYGVIAALDDVEDARRLRAVAMLVEAVGPAGLSGGQLRDLTPSRDAGLSDIELVHRGKTGALFAAAMGIGATIGASDRRSADEFARVGMSIGLAFQGFDDLLDAFATAAATGKDSQADAGKVTVASALGRLGGEKWACDHLEDGLGRLAGLGYGDSQLAGFINALSEALTRPLATATLDQRSA